MNGIWELALRHPVLGKINQYDGVSYVSHEGGKYRCMLCRTLNMHQGNADVHFNSPRHRKRHSAIAKLQRQKRLIEAQAPPRMDPFPPSSLNTVVLMDALAMVKDTQAKVDRKLDAIVKEIDSLKEEVASAKYARDAHQEANLHNRSPVSECVLSWETQAKVDRKLDAIVKEIDSLKEEVASAKYARDAHQEANLHNRSPVSECVLSWETSVFLEDENTSDV
jgi:hypothetical protein